MEESQTAHYCFNLSGLARTMNDLGLYGGYWLAARGCGDALSFFCILCRCFTPVKRRLTVIHLTHINGHVWIKMTWTSCLLSRKRSLNGLSTRCCSVPQVNISLFCTCQIQNHKHWKLNDTEQNYLITFSQCTQCGNTYSHGTGDFSKFKKRFFKSLVN